MFRSYLCVYQLVCFMDGPPPAQHCRALVTGGGRAGLLGAVTAKMGDNQDIYNAMHKIRLSAQSVEEIMLPR